HALAEDGVRGTVRFATRSSGVLTVAERDGTLWMDFPANPPAPAGVPAGLAGALGAEPVRAAAAGTGDLLVELASEEAVRALDPDIPRLGAFAERGVVPTAPAAPGRPHSFVSRFFAPNVGVAEDPVTGSAHTALAPYWAERLGRTAFDAVQCSARRGLLSLERAAGTPGRVRIGGTAVTVTEGELRYWPGPGRPTRLPAVQRRLRHSTTSPGPAPASTRPRPRAHLAGARPHPCF